METSYPFQDLSLDDLPDETWKPVPGFEGYYEVSSLGRIKSLERERIQYHGGIALIPERILRIRCGIVRNYSVGDNLFTLMVTLSLEGIKYSYSVGRLVYHAFVAPFELKDRRIMISYLDRDGRNLDYKNLFATNISALSNASYEKGRFISKLRKPVSQFDTKGKLIAQYASMYEAGRMNGFGERGIARVAGVNKLICQGFVWQSGHGKQLNEGKLVQSTEGGVNQALQPSSRKKTMPSANMSLKSIKGERWQDFPGYEGLYKISDHGRVKALRKVSEGKLKKWYPECIKKLTETNRNTTAEGSRHALVASLCKGQKKKAMSVARFVYYVFVEPFNMADRNLRVYYKDSNPHNLHYTNLILKNAVWSITRQ